MAGLHLRLEPGHALQVGSTLIARCDGTEWWAHAQGVSKVDRIDLPEMLGAVQRRVTYMEILTIEDTALILREGWYWMEGGEHGK
jgi:hypothetical protein